MASAPADLASVHVDSTDVIKIVLQFLKENNLNKAFRALQEEADVGLNTVPNLDAFVADIKAGKWEAVLPQVGMMKLPAEKLIDLYVQVVIEMVEIGEADTARALLRSTLPMTTLKREDPERYTRLERLLMRPVFNTAEAYPDGSNKGLRRAEIAEALGEEVVVVPPSRLMGIMGHSLKWQQHMGLLPPGLKYDVFRAAAPARKEVKEKVAKQVANTIRFATDAAATSALFTPDGQHLITGAADGIVEVYDYNTATVNTNVPFQAREQFIMCDFAVLSLACTRDSELLATGCADGSVKVWNLNTGRGVQYMPKAHAEAVGCVAFSKDGRQVLTGSSDTLVRLHGIVSGKTLKEFRGHAACVNDAKFLADGASILTCGSDGPAKLWDIKSSTCTRTIMPPQINAVTDTACNSVCLLPRSTDRFVVCNRTAALYIMNLAGEVVTRLGSGDDEERFMAAAISPRGKYVYGMAASNTLYVYNIGEAKLVAKLRVPDADGMGVVHHPHMNMVASFSGSGIMRLWRS